MNRPASALPPELDARLFDIARASILYGLEHNELRSIRIDHMPAPLRETGASFVTIKLANRLRGCVGSLEARQPLYQDVNYNAYRAAFHDPRFPALKPAEWPHLTLHIALLSKPEPIVARSEAELIAQLRPGVDGLVLQEGDIKATFLPSVWQSFPDPKEFFVELRKKAGLGEYHWSTRMRFQRYTARDANGDGS